MSGLSGTDAVGVAPDPRPLALPEPYYASSCGRAVLYHGDSEEVMGMLQPGSIDLVFTSPPYNLGNTSGGGFPSSGGLWQAASRSGGIANGYGDHHDGMPHPKYVDWQRRVLTSAWGTLSEAGAIYYNHKPRPQDGELLLPLDLNPGLPLRQIVIWHRGSGFNFSTSHYLPKHEWICIFAKKRFRLKSKKASGVSDVWEIRPEAGSTHPCPFPVALPERAIDSTTARIVLDPFCGSGTTLIAAIRRGRHAIGCDTSSKYLDLAASRIEVEIAQGSLFPPGAP